MISTKDLAWTAGFLEGEGSFCGRDDGYRGRRYLYVGAAQVQKEPLERLYRLFGGALYLDDDHRTRKGLNPIWSWRLSGAPEAAGLMMTLYGLMSPKRQEQIRRALDTWKRRGRSRAKNSLFCTKGHELRVVGVDRYGHCLPCRRKYLREWQALRRQKGRHDAQAASCTAS